MNIKKENKKQPNKDFITSFRLDKETKEALKKRAAELGRRPTEHVQILIAEDLKRGEEKQNI